MTVKSFEEALRDAEDITHERQVSTKTQTDIDEKINDLSKHSVAMGHNLDLVLALHAVNASDKVWRHLITRGTVNDKPITLKSILLTALDVYYSKLSPPITEEMLHKFATGKMMALLKTYRDLWDFEDD